MTSPVPRPTRVARLAGVAAALVAVLVVALLVLRGSGRPSASPPTGPTATGCTVSAVLAPSCGVLWGIENAQGSVSALTAEEARLNATLPAAKQRKFDVFRRFYSDFDTPFLGSRDERAIRTGHRLFISWNAGGTTYPAIAGGREDAVIDAAAERVRSLGTRRIFVDFQHEPDHFSVHPQGDPDNSAADYARAYQHVHDRFRADGITNVVWAWVMGGEGDRAHRDYDRAAYPGDAYVDWIGFDAYSAAAPYQEYPTFRATVQSYYDWLAGGGLRGAPNAIGGSDARSKPWLIGELGVSNTFASGPSWLASIPAGLRDLPNLRMVVYFNLGQWDLTSASAVPQDAAAYAAAGADPAVTGPASP